MIGFGAMKRHIFLVILAAASCDDGQPRLPDSTVALDSSAASDASIDISDASSFADAADASMDGQQ